MKSVFVLLFILLLRSCAPQEKYDIIISEIPANLGALNSPYDDYNSTLPYPAQRIPVYFSSNRNSQGKDFDFVSGKLDFSFHARDNVLNVKVPYDVPPSLAELIFPKVNSENTDELGPYFYYEGHDSLLFLYACNDSGSFDIKFVEVLGNNVSEVFSAAQINQTGDNLYPFIDKSRKKMYFCSNRNDSVFNIYSAEYNSEISRETLLGGDILTIRKEQNLSSSFNDKCPYINGNFMVFASDRDGNYDLWYSRLENGSWSEPSKFDDLINSPYNEYRPVLLNVLGFNLMIFSSDRPGGQGGYDLYIVKIDKYIR